MSGLKMYGKRTYCDLMMLALVLLTFMQRRIYTKYAIKTD